MSLDQRSAQMSLATSIQRTNLNARCFGPCAGRSPGSLTGSTALDPGQARPGPQGKRRTTAGTSRVVRAAAGATWAAKRAGLKIHELKTDNRAVCGNSRRQPMDNLGPGTVTCGSCALDTGHHMASSTVGTQRYSGI
jgi:hypothetical protein